MNDMFCCHSDSNVVIPAKAGIQSYYNERNLFRLRLGPGLRRGDNKLKGFTFIEILIAIFLISIVTALSFPAWHHLIHKNKVEITAQDLLQFLKTSRQYALEKDHSVLINIKDSSHQIIAQSQDQIIAELIIDENNIKLSWASNFGKNDHLVFMPNGMTNGQQGHFTISSTSSSHKTELVVQMSGNVYVRSKNLSMLERT